MYTQVFHDRIIVIQHGEVVRFNDFLRMLPKSDEQQAEDLDEDEEEMADPKQPIV